MLELYSNQELLDELNNRPLFAGILIYSQKEMRNNGDYIHENWQVAYGHLTEEAVCEILSKTAKHFEKLSEAE